MAVSRQDAWGKEEDLILAEVVLRHIRDGSTQLAAFEEIGERLSRTAAACGFRWNSLVRKQYQSAISLAKKQRKQLKQPRSVSAGQVSEETSISLDDVIAYLEKYRSAEEGKDSTIKENEQLKLAVVSLKEEKERLAQAIEDVKEENRWIQEDYRALITIMDRARKRVSHHDGEADMANQ